MAKIWAWNTATSGGGGGGEPTGPAGGVLSGEYPNPTAKAEGIKEEALEKEAVSTAKVKLLAITAALLGAEAVTTAKLKLLSVTAAILGAESVETAKIKLLAVEAGQLGEGAVTAAKLGSESVTAAKIKGEEVVAAAIKKETITKEKLAPAVQEVLEPKILERTWTIPDGQEVKNEVLGGFVVKLGTSEVKKIIAVTHKTKSGTIKLALKGGAAGETEISAYKELSATSSFATTTSTAVLAAAEYITLTASSGSTAKGLTLTAFIQVG
jgi:hypothetical protein